MDQETTLAMLKEQVREFVAKRDWQQFHTLKNLSMSIAIEAAELMELFQWEKDSGAPGLTPAKRREVEQEVADVVLYVLGFCNTLNIDLSTAIKRKIELNKKKYPVRKVKGKSHKYTHYQKRVQE